MYHHSLNHLHAPVHGILLGSCASNSEFLISDVLPCFHGFPTPNVLEASLEAAEGGVKGEIRGGGEGWSEATTAPLENPLVFISKFPLVFISILLRTLFALPVTNNLLLPPSLLGLLRSQKDPRLVHSERAHGRFRGW